MLVLVKKILPIIGLVLLLGFFLSGYKYLNNWSTAELVGYNIWALIELFGGAYLLHVGFKGKNGIKSG